MKMFARMAAFVLMAGLTAPATAVVTYSYTNSLNQSSFSWTSSDYITALTEVDAADLDACSSGIFEGECVRVRFTPNFKNNPNSSNIYSVVSFQIGSVGYVFYFPQIAFTTAGVYENSIFEKSSLLAVIPSRDHPPFQVVPEPGTWAMLIAGFGLVGAARRRMRAAAA